MEYLKVAKSLRTVAQLAEELPAFDQAAIRRLIFNAKENGLAPALFKIGRRIYIDVRLFNRWLEERRMSSEEAPWTGHRRRVVRLV